MAVLKRGHLISFPWETKGRSDCEKGMEALDFRSKSEKANTSVSYTAF